MTLALESTSNRMSRLARNAIVHGRQISAEEVEAAFDAVDARGGRRAGARTLRPDERGLCVLGPLDARRDPPARAARRLRCSGTCFWRAISSLRCEPQLRSRRRCSHRRVSPRAIAGVTTEADRDRDLAVSACSSPPAGSPILFMTPLLGAIADRTGEPWRRPRSWIGRAAPALRSSTCRCGIIVAAGSVGIADRRAVCCRCSV